MNAILHFKYTNKKLYKKKTSIFIMCYILALLFLLLVYYFKLAWVC